MKLGDIKKYKKALLLGYGVEGAATEKYLKKHLPDIKLDIISDVAEFDFSNFNVYDQLVIKSPGIPGYKLSVPYTTATNIFFANAPGFKIGITGTKGKSTCSSLLYSILISAGLDTCLVGNIGNPMLDAIDQLTDKSYSVIELSSYQLADINYSPQIGVFLNIFYEHIPYHKNFANYLSAKSQITANQSESDYFVFNPDIDIISTIKTKATKVPIINLSPSFNTGRLSGDHNRSNIAASITVARLLGVNQAHISQAIEHFIPLEHRFETIGEYQGIKFIDDSASTNPISTIAAIKNSSNIGMLLLGGLDRGYDFTDMVKLITETKISSFILFPETEKKITDLLKKYCNYTVNIINCPSMKMAVKLCFEYVVVGQCVLLSPGTPSFNMYKNFSDRGDQFKHWVKYYGNQKKI